MASAWLQSTKASRTDGLVTTYQKLPHSQVDLQRVCFKTRLTLMMKKMLKMSKCSQTSRSLLVQMRDQLKEALEQEGIVAPDSAATAAPFSHPQQQELSQETSSNTQLLALDGRIGAASTDEARSTSRSGLPVMRHLDCAYCAGFMVQPVCLPCGHSVCKSCVDKTVVGGDLVVCPACNQTFPYVPLGFGSNNSSRSNGGSGESGKTGTGGGGGGASLPRSDGRRPTLILQNALLKWYPEWVESSKHKDEGNVFANEGDFPVAVHWYSRALQTGVLDHRVLGNRSRAYLAMERLDEALLDAETACQLRPFWPKGHFRRAAVLVKQDRWQEALGAYLLCLHLGSSDQSVVETACQLLDKKLLSLSRADSSGSADKSGGGLQATCGALSGAIIKKCVDLMLLCTRGQGGPDTNAHLPQHLVKDVDFECVLCTGLLFCPITTPCGHSFCQSCLSRAFDHSPFCPICRASLAERFHQHCQQAGKMNEDIVLRNVLMQHFLEAYEEKRTQVLAEIQLELRIGVSDTEELPIFVCTMAYPGMPCPLHIFEPRYRLMIRRCVEGGSRRFGMCQPAIEEGSDNFSFSDYGTVLFINSVEYTPDGRSLITTTGERRFKVVGRSMRDGYNCAKIKFVFDEQINDPAQIGSLRALQEEVYEHARKWLNALPHITRVMIMQTLCSPLPPIESVPENCPNGPMWVWWYIHALPTTPTRKIEFLKCTSLRTRLQMLRESLPVPS